MVGLLSRDGRIVACGSLTGSKGASGETIILADRLGFSEAFVGPAQAMAALDGTAGDGGDAAVLAVRRRDPSEMRC